MFQTNPKSEPYSDFIRAEAKKLREKDEAPKSREEWEQRKKRLREAMFSAMGSFPEKPSALEPRILGTLRRDGYSIEKLIFQSQPNVWVTASAYVPTLKEGAKVPAVLVVHGHWPWARRDPVVQARCLGLVKLGFLVLAVDAFGSGERYHTPARGTYHGALYGSTLWPVGQTLLGMQVYDNRRAVDYLLSRPEVNGKLGVTGASGGGNQSMYAGALDERFQAVVPVCSVGNYQSYLHAACCVCEVLPGALRFTEEGDVLGLVAPRGLLVMNATKDGIQFSPAEAQKSVARAKSVFQLYGMEKNLRHDIFESPHDYNQKMREAMYGWMTFQLKGEGKGDPIPEPKHDLEKIEDLTCFPDPKDRPTGFFFPTTFAFSQGKALREKADKLAPTHPEMWQATMLSQRNQLAELLGGVSGVANPKADIGALERIPNTKPLQQLTAITLQGEGEVPIHLIEHRVVRPAAPPPIALLIHPEGKKAALAHPLAKALLDKTTLLAADLRGLGETKPARDAIAGSADHNSAEHAVWVGRPLLGQWIADIETIVNWLMKQNPMKRPRVLVGFGAMAIPVLLANAYLSFHTTIAVDIPSTLLTETAYATGTQMGILAPGILKIGDVPHLASLGAPRQVILVDSTTPNGKKLTAKEQQEAFAFTTQVYKAWKAPAQCELLTNPRWEDIVNGL